MNIAWKQNPARKTITNIIESIHVMPK
jgi:hypothetical protein